MALCALGNVPGVPSGLVSVTTGGATTTVCVSDRSTSVKVRFAVAVSKSALPDVRASSRTTWVSMVSAASTGASFEPVTVKVMVFEAEAEVVSARLSLTVTS
ncbi:hypothetical protein AFCDBAGC_2650 [Methylobacterium cerastii]|uniref:Secreted protein n=1 Tax=Methylobacterium cerastii TaxID=932741 RepID=A0ABQ4QHQ9_9HYPH|nr:hypothetical protein AFCDBAGC_2650 [Methylobacterium cerastii]